jgi:lysyl-tRNA synthetase class 2
MENKINKKDELTPTQFMEMRLKNSENLCTNFVSTTTIHSIVSKYKNVYSPKDGTDIRDRKTRVFFVGRVYSIRIQSKKLMFMTLGQQGSSTIQVIADLNEYMGITPFDKIFNDIYCGDIVGIIGFMGVSKRGELSVYIYTRPKLISKCLIQLPQSSRDNTSLLSRTQCRVLDYVANSMLRDFIVLRSNTNKKLEDYLHSQGFTGVNTSILSLEVGGASAKPFKTLFNEMGKEGYMRVSPELFLKELIASGIVRVYERGPSFRNEGIDGTHSPEFEMIEGYMADMSYEDMIKLMHALFNILIPNSQLNLKDKFGNNVLIDFSKPFARMDIMTELTKRYGTFPDDLSSDDAKRFLYPLCMKLGLNVTNQTSNAKLMDKIISTIEDVCVQPTILEGHPMILSPLSLEDPNRKGIAVRGELFMMNTEIANFYCDEYDSIRQAANFNREEQNRKAGDDETQTFNQQFIKSLQLGMYPTSSFGIGLDRIFMFILESINTNRSRPITIHDVRSFPMGC